jgi:hypothetical protein
MSGAQKTTFTERFPATEFTDEDVASALSSPSQIVSLRGRRIAPTDFVVKFASRSGVVGPFIFNRASAEAMKRLLHEQGF